MSQSEAQTKRRARRTQIGRVTSAKMQETIVVEVERLVRHPRYDKYVRRRTKLYAHNANNEAREGDTVEVMATRPLSKLKRWRLVRIVGRPQSA
ncbi:MAG TPA: 30S ribosomal protein S17 [Planctomycetota bacterium]|nr:30S ribosomal protein S17 [Planctomycetota bacterium]